MRTIIRKVGNSLGVIIPRELVDAWGASEGDSMEIDGEGIRPVREQGRAQDLLDNLKREIALEVLSTFNLEVIRQRSIDNLRRWKKARVWGPAYEEWLEIMKNGEDRRLIHAMAGRDQESNRLRQSMPYTGMLPHAVLKGLREKKPA
jgi:antitoxin component of MazEF toxin-antitoxin module